MSVPTDILLLQGIFPTQRWNPHLLHWQDPLLPSHQGSPNCKGKDLECCCFWFKWAFHESAVESPGRTENWNFIKNFKQQLRSRTRQEGLLSPFLFSIVLEILVREIRQETGIKGIQIEKQEIKLSLFADETMLYVENPKETIEKKLLVLMNEFNKFVEYKINIQYWYQYTIWSMINIKYTINIQKAMYFYLHAVNNPKLKLRKKFNF